MKTNKTENTNTNKTVSGMDLVSQSLAEYEKLMQEKAEREQKLKDEFIEKPEQFIQKHSQELYLNTNNFKTTAMQIISDQIKRFEQDAKGFAEHKYSSEFASKSYDKALSEVSRYVGLAEIIKTIQPVAPLDKAEVILKDVKAGTVENVGTVDQFTNNLTIGGK